MINIGDLEIAGVYIGDTQLSVYAGDVLLYPTSTANLTGISLDNLTWVTDVPGSGGTATSANCSFTVTGYYDNNTTRNITNLSTISGSLVVPSTSAETREMVGTLTLTASYSGFTDSDTVGVYQEAVVHNYANDYLTFIIEGNGKINWKGNNNSFLLTIQYSKNNGAWTNITATTGSSGTSINVVSGDVLTFKGTNTNYGNGGTSIWNCFRYSSAKFSVQGNIMSLVYGDNFIGQTALTGTYNFVRFFQNCNSIQSAENLVLPATVLTEGCYVSMFDTSSSLTKAPSSLPATTLAEKCYNNMFLKCSKITTAPELPAATLVSNCYNAMFNSCSSLKYIKCLATSGINTNNSTYIWVTSVGSGGTFVKKSGVTWPTGINGIPNGWTVQEE